MVILRFASTMPGAAMGTTWSIRLPASPQMLGGYGFSLNTFSEAFYDALSLINLSIFLCKLHFVSPGTWFNTYIPIFSGIGNHLSNGNHQNECRIRIATYLLNAVEEPKMAVLKVDVVLIKNRKTPGWFY